MKTIGEQEAERAEERQKMSDERKRYAARMDDLDQQQIPVFVSQSNDSTDYEKVRQGLRDLIREGSNGQHFFYRYPIPVGLACDHCKTEVFYPSPGQQLLSNPPQKKITCPGCGWIGYLTQ